MRKLIVLPTLLLGLSFACERPHEEVYKIKIGCPYGENTEDFKAQEYFSGVSFSKFSLEKGLFETVDIDILNGNIEGLTFSKSYTSNLEADDKYHTASLALIEADYRDISANLIGQFGDASEFKTDMFHLLMIKEPKSNILNHIAIMSIYDYSEGVGTIEVSFVSNTLKEHAEKVPEQLSLKGFLSN